MIVLPVPSHLSPPVIAELVQANLITSKERRRVRLMDPRHVVEVQRGKSPEVLTKTAEVLLRHGLEEESNLLAGKQTQPLIHVPVVCCTVEPSCKSHLKASIIVSSTHTMLGHSEYQSHTAFPHGHLKHLLAHTNPFPWVVNTNAEPHMQSSSIP